MPAKAELLQLRQQLLQELKSGPQGIQRWNALGLKQRQEAGHFRKADLSGQDLSCADLQSLDFQKADLAGSVLAKAMLGYCKLKGANLRKASLPRQCQTLGLQSQQGHSCRSGLEGRRTGAGRSARG
jgi:uncharacterized protein YjbI with pentapeptide repeats